MIAISVGHYGKGTGAVGLIDEVEEAEKVVNEVSAILSLNGVAVHKILDKQSKNQRQNLQYLMNAHASVKRKIDVFVHFNAAVKTEIGPIGTEVLYKDGLSKQLAKNLSVAISQAGHFINRGAKQRTDLYVLNTSTVQSVIVEICFVNSKEDVKSYKQNFQAICNAISETLIIHLGLKYTPIRSNTFSSTTLQSAFQEILKDEKVMEKMLHVAIREQIIQQSWLTKFKTMKMTQMDLCAIALLVIKKQCS